MLDLYINVRNTLGAFESKLRVAIANADNFNVTGYKYISANFTSVYNDVMSSGTSNTNPIQFGGSVALGGTSIDFTTGTLGFGTSMDCAITGSGFFVLARSSSASSSEKVYTRAGAFALDFSGQFLVDNAFGRQVFGYELNEDGSRKSEDLVPIQTNGETDIGFIDGGILVKNFAAQTTDINNAVVESEVRSHVPMYQLAMTTFRNQQGLIQETGGAFRASNASGEPAEFGTSNEGTFGTVLAQQLEGSNVDVARLGLDMAQLNRSFSAVQGVLDDINKILSGLISKMTT